MIAADRVTTALVAAMGQLVTGLGDATFLRESHDAVLLFSGVPFPTMNGVITTRPSASPREVGDLLDAEQLATIVHCIQIRPGCSPSIVDLAVGRGMNEDHPIPLMAIEKPGHELQEAAMAPQLSIRTIEPREAGLHAEVAADGFGVPVEMFNTFAKPSVLSQPGMRAYVGSVDGAPVTTALSVRGDDYVGIFDVATPPPHRGHGYGAAITARAALDGFEAGALFAFLQSSPMGFRVYEQLGFRTLETWSVWIASPSQRPVA